RPNFMKVAPLLDVLRERPGVEARLVHTGQHYDERLSRLFFEELGIPRPDRSLDVGGGTHAEQTAAVMLRFEPVLLEERPDVVVVVGDVNSTVACAMVAAKCLVPVAHVEAGLRSFDRTMPEEVNRLVTDAISDLLFASEPAGVRNLRAEGVDASRVHFVGNVMIDTLRRHRERAEETRVLEDLGLERGRFAVLTLHRPSNVDDPAVLGRILGALEEVGARVPVVFPVHPRTLARIKGFGLAARLDAVPGLRVVEPQGYLEFLKLEAHAAVVLTDSGGVQEETTALGVPCVTIRENTERPVTLDLGTNVLVGTDPARIAAEAVAAIERTRPAEPRVPALWDGRAAQRIADVLVPFCASRRRTVEAA
ncbi:MAG TPA: UDP-N-acetylglucosamine 2-epimerase (non-hydrolyzing), partial [Planctomycetota bacterium]|nr:UDP-N-acetylglucosamine 2-epimerase (non-hydrolyzing) [Planctomycetota bacterium]